MAIKDVREYYKKVCEDYSSMLENLKDMEDSFNENLVSEEQLNQVKKLVEPIKNNYMTLSWVMFLLDKPARKEKFEKYDRQMTKFKKGLDIDRNKEHVLVENADTLTKMKNFTFN